MPLHSAPADNYIHPGHGHAPALATMVDGTTLVCVYRSTDGILYYIVFDGSTWSGGENHYVRRERSMTGPGLTAGFMNDRDVVWCTHQSENGGWWQSYYQGGYSPGWPGSGGAPTERSHSAKACATYDRRLNFVHRREDGYYLERTTPNGVGWEVPAQRMGVSNHTAAPPVLITHDDALHLYYMR